MKGSPAILMMHDFAQSSDSWLINKPENNIAMHLANKGDDIWLGNIRGNKYGRSHLKLNPDSKNLKEKKEFFQFSW